MCKIKNIHTHHISFCFYNDVNLFLTFYLTDKEARCY